MADQGILRITDATGEAVCEHLAPKDVPLIMAAPDMLAELLRLVWYKDASRDFRCRSCLGYHPLEVLQDESRRGHRPWCRTAAVIVMATGKPLDPNPDWPL